MEELAKIIHDKNCNRMDLVDNCLTWKANTSYGQAHRDFYQLRAESISRQLAPVIGSANVSIAAKVILEEMS